MTGYLCISVTLLDPLFHGRAGHGEPEWPPSPLRLFQAMLRGARTGCRNSNWTDAKAAAFQWLERCEPPVIVSPQVNRASEYTLFVPNNDSDKEPERQNRLTSKVARPHRLPEDVEDRTLHYLWPISDANDSLALKHAQLLRDEARHLLALGWGIDQAVATGRILTEWDTHALKRNGVTWRPLIDQHPSVDARRVPKGGTLNDLETVYRSFINRVDGRQYTPPLKPSVFDRVRYVPPSFTPTRPYAVFELQRDPPFRYSQRQLIHIAGMVRCLAIRIMRKSPPRGVADDWVERYVAGHRPKDEPDHRQLSYLPLPSIGHEHADQIVRRVMIVAPHGDEHWLEHVARRLAGQQLIPMQGDEFGGAGPPTLVRVPWDNVARFYTRPANRWASVTPVILPGHDDKKPAKRLKLIRKALHDAGVEQPCEFEWSAFSRFRKSYSAHKYDKRGPDKGKIGYFRPDHLLSQTAVHLTVRFQQPVPGPLTIGAGRHCGFGLMAVIDSRNA